MYGKSHYQIVKGAEPVYYPGNQVGCLLLHGFSATPHEMKHLAKYLAGFGYTVYIPRIPHHGTDRMDLERTRPWDWYLSAVDAWHVLSKQCKYIIPIGYSMGGVLALSLAAKKPVQAVISISSPYITKLPWWWSVRYIFKHLVKTIPSNKQPWKDRKVQNSRICYSKHSIAGIIAGIKGLQDYPVFLQNLEAPTLLIYGDNDKIVPIECMEKTFQSIKSKHKQKIVVESINHHLVLDQVRHKVFPLISTYINQELAKNKQFIHKK